MTINAYSADSLTQAVLVEIQVILDVEIIPKSYFQTYTPGPLTYSSGSVNSK